MRKVGWIVGAMGIAAVAMAGLEPGAAAIGGVPDFSGTPRQRKGLFDALTRDTLAWEAFSPEKDAALELDFAEQADEMRRDFLAADHERKLFTALLRYSNLRRNGSLGLRLVDDGLRLDRDHQELPVRFALDEESDELRIFVCDHDEDVQRKLNMIQPKSAEVEPGDVVLQVDGQPIEQIVGQLGEYVASSTERQKWSEVARILSLQRHDLPHDLFKKDVTFGIEKKNGKRYKLRVSYIDETERLRWAIQWRRPQHDGLDRAFQSSSFDVYTATGRGQATTLLIEGREFREDSEEDVERLREWVKEQGAQQFDVVLDLTRASGSTVPWGLLRLLIAQPVQPTRARLRVSDLTTTWMSRVRPRASPELRAWLDEVVRPAASSYKPADEPVYLPPVPADLVVAHDSDGLLQPAELHFEGKRALIVDASSSPAVNQLAAIWIDNEIGPSFGTAPFGNANAWVWRDEISLPREKRPLIEFEWNLGHVLRPGGEILEGNPPIPSEHDPVGAEDFQGWHGRQVERALAAFAKESP